MNLTLDANIWVIAQDSSDVRQTACLGVLKKIYSNPGITVCSPYLMEVEVLASIARITKGDAEKINKARQWIWSLPYQDWSKLDKYRVKEASDCAVLYGLRGADAVYVATALKNNATLLTYDEDIIKRTPQKDLTVMKPDDWLKQQGEHHASNH